MFFNFPFNSIKDIWIRPKTTIYFSKLLNEKRHSSKKSCNNGIMVVYVSPESSWIGLYYILQSFLELPTLSCRTIKHFFSYVPSQWIRVELYVLRVFELFCKILLKCNIKTWVQNCQDFWILFQGFWLLGWWGFIF